jgi:hypothetical protein
MLRNCLDPMRRDTARLDTVQNYCQLPDERISSGGLVRWLKHADNASTAATRFPTNGLPTRIALLATRTAQLDLSLDQLIPARGSGFGRRNFCRHVGDAQH